MSPAIDCMKHGEFKWTNVAAKVFGEIKNSVTKALVM